MNRDIKTIQGFGEEWDKFDQLCLTEEERKNIFNAYFSIFPWDLISEQSIGFDMGCGSGRWAQLVAPRVGKLYCFDPAFKALAVARNALSQYSNVHCVQAGVDDFSLADNSMDFGYSLGVLHHVPDTQSAIKSCVDKLKTGAPFLIYLYYALENRPFWFRILFKCSNTVRWFIARLPNRVKHVICQLIAAGVYFPLACFARFMERCGKEVHHYPLTFYRDKSFYVMCTDARDRFGTRLEQRFTRAQIEHMLQAAGLTNIIFSEHAPFWCAVGIKK